MILRLLEEATVANGGLGAAPALSDSSKIKQFYGLSQGNEAKLRAAGPNSSTAWQRTVLICTTTRMTTELVAQVVLTNVNWQGAPQTVLDPSGLWYAFAPGNGTFGVGASSVTISGDTEISATGATNGLSGVNVSVEKN